jgi:hypothetical protein
LRLRGELTDAVLRLGQVEPDAAFVPGLIDRALVEGGSQLRLADMFESDCKIVGVVGIGWFQLVRLEIGLLRFGPARLVAVQIAQREIECGLWFAGDQLLSAAIGSARPIIAIRPVCA